MSRIGLNDKWTDVLYKMSEGNPGALTAMLSIIDAASVGEKGHSATFIPLVHLDMHGIYGPRIWMLYKGVFKFRAKALRYALMNNCILKVIEKAKRDERFAKQWDYYGEVKVL